MKSYYLQPGNANSRVLYKQIERFVDSQNKLFIV